MYYSTSTLSSPPVREFALCFRARTALGTTRYDTCFTRVVPCSHALSSDLAEEGVGLRDVVTLGTSNIMSTTGVIRPDHKESPFVKKMTAHE
jgi:hypothetical protein